MDRVKLSKTISYALRHRPEEFGLELDRNGWVDTKTLVNSLKKKLEFDDLDTNKLITLLEGGDRIRHEIKEGRIRASYGHSLKDRIQKVPSKPPNTLYHGTLKKNIDSIMKLGLNTKNRQYVHLFDIKEKAMKVASRRKGRLCTIIVNSKKAFEQGLYFYCEGDIWLSDNIHPKFLEYECYQT